VVHRREQVLILLQPFERRLRHRHLIFGQPRGPQRSRAVRRMELRFQLRVPELRLLRIREVFPDALPIALGARDPPACRA